VKQSYVSSYSPCNHTSAHTVLAIIRQLIQFLYSCVTVEEQLMVDEVFRWD